MTILRLTAACLLAALALLVLAAVWYQRRYGAPKGFDFAGDDAWRCVRCGAVVQDVWDLEPHRLSHRSPALNHFLF